MNHKIARMPITLREMSTRLEYTDFPEASEIVAEIEVQLLHCKADLLDVAARHAKHIIALEEQLKTALKLEPNQAVNFGSDHALVVNGTPLSGESLELLRRCIATHKAFRLLGAATVEANKDHQSVFAAM
jgi:hypothetical protein